MTVTGPFLLTKTDFSKTEVVKTYVYTIVASVIDYWKETMKDKKGTQRQWKTRKGLNWIFNLYEHPEIRTQTRD